MSLLSLCSQAVTIVRRDVAPGGDAYGGDSLVVTAEVPATARLHHTVTSDDLVDQRTTTTRWAFTLPAPYVIGRNDLVRDDQGVEYRVVGEPYRTRRPPSGEWIATECELVECHG